MDENIFEMSVRCGTTTCDDDGNLVNCSWASWTAWGTCSATCRGGAKFRSRYVEKTPQNGGVPCIGESVESEVCGTIACDDSLVNCTWASWTTWGTCSATCGRGTQLRSRYVEYIAKNGGAPCSGESVQSEACVATACDDGGIVNCTWASWTTWGTCSATCGRGTQLRSRYVEYTAQNGGDPCSGESVESQACATTACGGGVKGWLNSYISSHTCLSFTNNLWFFS